MFIFGFVVGYIVSAVVGYFFPATHNAVVSFVVAQVKRLV